MYLQSKKTVKQQYLLQVSPQYDELRPTRGLRSVREWGTPANFNGFRVLASLVERYVVHRRPTPTKLCTIFGRLLGCYTRLYVCTLSSALAPWRNFATCKIHFVSKSCVLLYWQRYCTTLQQLSQSNFAAWYKEWNYGTFAEGATYIRLGCHHVGHRPTF